MSNPPPIQPPVGTLLPPANAAEGSATDPNGWIDSRTLFQGQRAVAISHNGVVYRLQATRQGKLILTK